MTGRNSWGWVLFAGGLLLLNYVYLHDLIWQRHGGFVVLGLKSYAGAAFATAIAVVGAVMLHRAGRRW